MFESQSSFVIVKPLPLALHRSAKPIVMWVSSRSIRLTLATTVINLFTALVNAAEPNQSKHSIDEQSNVVCKVLEESIPSPHPLIRAT